MGVPIRVALIPGNVHVNKINPTIRKEWRNTMDIKKIAREFLKARNAIRENDKMLTMLDADDHKNLAVHWDNILHYEDAIRQMCKSLGLDGETKPVETMHEFLKSAKPFESNGANRGPLLYTDIKVRHYNFN